MSSAEQFEKECKDRVVSYGKNKEFQNLSLEWVRKCWGEKYSYNFRWLGRPIIQLPQDMVAMQEIIWEVQPDLIIETGVAHGGSLIFYASLLELIGRRGMVIGVERNLWVDNRKAILEHPLAKRIKLVDGDSSCPDVIQKVTDIASSYSKILVCLDSGHSKDHVLKELRAYAPLVSIGGYLIVYDTIMEYLEGVSGAVPGCTINNPKQALNIFLKENDHFRIQEEWNHKILISHNPQGFLYRYK